ncbi:hypothetical protein JOD27_004317 [Lentzea nigeriaca]|nr:hypothetical protein [Lentzea nigeriaca]
MGLTVHRYGFSSLFGEVDDVSCEGEQFDARRRHLDTSREAAEKDYAEGLLEGLDAGGDGWLRAVERGCGLGEAPCLYHGREREKLACLHQADPRSKSMRRLFLVRSRGPVTDGAGAVTLPVGCAATISAYGVISIVAEWSLPPKE